MLTSGAEFWCRVPIAEYRKNCNFVVFNGNFDIKGGEGEGKETLLSIKASVLLANQN